MNPLVSILIPCYNADRTVGPAIESALSQDHPNVEVIVMDDGSTDQSPSVIRRFAEQGRIRFETGPNRGGSAARNRLLAMAASEYVQFLDADDLLDPSKVRRCLRAMSDDVDAVVCGYQRRSAGRDVAVPPIMLSDDLARDFIVGEAVTTVPLHRKACLLSAGGFDERLRCCQEYELHLRLARRHWRRVISIPETLCTIVRTPGSVSSDEARVFSCKATILEQVHAELEREQQLTPARAEAIARVLHNCGRHLARHQLDVQAQRAFDLARRIAPHAIAPARWPMRALAGAIGPVRAEHWRARLCRTLGRDV